MGNDQKFKDIDAETLFHHYFKVFLNDKQILNICQNVAWPSTQQIEVVSDSNNNTLMICDGNDLSLTLLPDFKHILVTLKIDKNMVFTIDFTIISYEMFSTYFFQRKFFINDETVNAVGIDFGVTSSCAAVNRRNGIESVALDNKGERLLPSYVAYDEKNVKCGKIVRDRLRNHLKASALNVKKYIGIQSRNLLNGSINSMLQISSIRDSKRLSEIEIHFKIQAYNGEILKNPEEILADLLKHIKGKVVEFQGKDLEEVVITLPVAFSKNQNEAIYAAARLAGWNIINFLPEPIAGVFGYYINRAIPNNHTLLLFDLGGGTLDISILRIQNNQLHIISNHRNPNLGGRDFDNILIEYFQSKLHEKMDEKIIENKKYKLMLKCQDIKENLSIYESHSLDVDEFDPTSHEEINITRSQFEIFSVDLIQQIQKNIKIALNKINYNAKEINKILQVGGCCRMPMIKKILKEMFPDAEQCCDKNPDEVVAIGAAYYAYCLSNINNENNENKRKSVFGSDFLAPPIPPKLYKFF